jgi:hypothetical protein
MIKEATNIEALKFQLYTSIHKLPLNLFIDVAVDHNLQALIISGEPDTLQLIEAWEDIKQQYSDSIGDAVRDMEKSLLKSIVMMKVKVDSVNKCIAILEVFYVKQFADRLNSLLSTKFNFDVTKPAEYDELLNRCLKRTGGIKIEIALAEKRLEGMTQKKPSAGSEISREYFDKILVTLSDHAGHELNEETLTVFKFCERVKRFNKYCEDQGRLRK